jgi:uncharacterized protein YbjT (DUF2867 family)
MHVTVFGATGGVGRNLMSQLLEEGHTVTAFTRDRARLEQTAPGLNIAEGEFLDPDAVSRALDGADAVICALGMPLFNRQKLRAKGTAVIVQAMEQAGLKRLVCLSGMGAGDSWSMLPLRYRWLIVPLFMRRLYDDHEAQETVVRSSNLEWTIVRPRSFTDGARTRTYQYGFTQAPPSLAYKIARADVADFMVRQLGDNTYLLASPALSH